MRRTGAARTCARTYRVRPSFLRPLAAAYSPARLKGLWLSPLADRGERSPAQDWEDARWARDPAQDALTEFHREVSVKQRMLARLHKHGKITRRALLAEMDRAIPWAELEAAMHALGDGIDAGADPTPDEMTISRFRELLARHGIGEQILAAAHLELEHDRISVTNERSAGPTPATPRAGSAHPFDGLGFD